MRNIYIYTCQTCRVSLSKSAVVINGLSTQCADCASSLPTDCSLCGGVATVWVEFRNTNIAFCKECDPYCDNCLEDYTECVC